MSETDEQKALVKWYRQTYPQWRLSLRVSQSGQYRGKGRQGAIRTAQSNAMGTVTGEADVAILLPRGDFGCLLIELKGGESSWKATDDQIEYIQYHNQVGNCACVCKGVEMAKLAIQEYLCISKTS